MSNPFDFLNSINTTKEDLIANAPDLGIAERAYPAFMVNRGLSYFPDTIMYANDTNSWAHVDPYLQYSYLMGSIQKRKRFSKWAKPDKSDDVQVVIDYYGYSRRRAEATLGLLSSEQLNEMRAYLDPGGK